MTEPLMQLVDRLDYINVPMTVGDWNRIAQALRLAVEWLEADKNLHNPLSTATLRTDVIAQQTAKDAFRRAVEGEP